MAMLLVPAYAEKNDDPLLKLLHRSNAVYSPLEAAEYGSAERMKKAVQAEPTQVNDVDELGRTPLHLAAARGDVALVGILLEAGADASAKNAAGHQAIDVAQGEDVVNLLKTAGVKREKELALGKAVKNGKIEEAKAALAAGVNVNALSEDRSGNMLSVAVYADNVEMVQLLLRAGADVNAVPHGAKSVLHCAAARSKGEIVRALLAAGADPMHPGNNGASALHEAIWVGNSAAVEALIPAYAGCNFSPDGRHNGYPIGMAIRRGRADYVQLFLNAGIDVNDKCFAKEPLLHQAVKHNRVFMVKMLLDAGAKRNARDAQGKKAVEYAHGEAYELLK
ncbi:MAG: ankyrin repeat domain-containing protein [Akkermansia sp.]|nr:ankyrin repeat domain-containing protein [Akkermansia sp.]